MSNEFPLLFSPFKLGSLTLKNRLVSSPHGTHMAIGGLTNQSDLEHHIRLAEGGVGLIISGGTVVHASSSLRNKRLVEAYNDDVLPGLHERSAAVHKEGAALICQLFHLGRELIGGESDEAPLAPSAVKTVRDPYPPHVMSAKDIEQVIDGFAKSARNMEISGHDGVEIHAAHGYLVSQFLSPATNFRTDSFGGSLENRMRFLHLILDAVKANCSKDFVLGVRLSAEEEIPNGLDTEQSVEIAISLSERVDVNYLSITHGTRGTYVKDASNPDGVAIESASKIKAASGLPMLVAQRIRDPFLGEDILRNGHADLIGMTRALLADPELPKKAAEGRQSEIRTCIGLNQDCRMLDPHLRCTINAEIGRPINRSHKEHAEAKKKVTIIGGGPAGLEAARVALGRGHQVTLFEKNTILGGQLLTASLAPFRSSILDVVDFQKREIARLGGVIHLGVDISLSDLEEIEKDCDVIVFATGSNVVRKVMPGHSNTVTVDDVLKGLDLSLVRSAVVFDESDGFWPAYNAVEKLSQLGIDTTLITPLSGLAGRLPMDSIGPLFARFSEKNVKLLPHHKIISANLNKVQVSQIVSPHEFEIDADLLVWHSGRTADDYLYLNMTSNEKLVRSSIGDCVTPRRLNHAISDGYRIATSI